MAVSTKSISARKVKRVAKTVSTHKKLDAKQAVANAVGYFQEFFPLHAKSNMLLEELEESTDGKRWLVTLGYDAASRAPRAALFDGGLVRSYKLFSVDSISGKVISVKIRTV